MVPHATRLTTSTPSGPTGGPAEATRGVYPQRWPDGVSARLVWWAYLNAYLHVCGSCVQGHALLGGKRVPACRGSRCIWGGWVVQRLGVVISCPCTWARAAWGSIIGARAPHIPFVSWHPTPHIQSPHISGRNVLPCKHSCPCAHSWAHHAWDTGT